MLHGIIKDAAERWPGSTGFHTFKEAMAYGMMKEFGYFIRMPPWTLEIFMVRHLQVSPPEGRIRLFFADSQRQGGEPGT